MTDETQKPLTIDEINAMLSTIARTGEKDIDRMRALKMLRAEEGSNVALSDPLSDSEAIDRLARLIKAVGPTAASIAYRRAFPKSQKAINQTTPKLTADHVPNIDMKTMPANLPQFYRLFPEVKRKGFPVGYPQRGSIAAKKEWCQAQAVKILLEREQHKIETIAVEAQDAKLEAPDGPPA